MEKLNGLLLAAFAVMLLCVITIYGMLLDEKNRKVIPLQESVIVVDRDMLNAEEPVAALKEARGRVTTSNRMQGFQYRFFDEFGQIRGVFRADELVYLEKGASGQTENIAIGRNLRLVQFTGEYGQTVVCFQSRNGTILPNAGKIKAQGRVKGRTYRLDDVYSVEEIVDRLDEIFEASEEPVQVTAVGKE